MESFSMNRLTRSLSTCALAFSAVFAMQAPALAQTTVYEFGQLLSGDGAPADVNFASLSATVVGKDIVFTLDAGSLDLFSGKQPFLGALAVDGDKVGSLSGISGDAPVSLANGGGPNGGWEFRFDFTGPKQQRLVDDEAVSWTWVGGAGHFSGMAAHVQGMDYGPTDSAWYTAVAVPEPGAYAMFLSGLAVLGAAAVRRRKTKR
jgi:hypothetical protein